MSLLSPKSDSNSDSSSTEDSVPSSTEAHPSNTPTLLDEVYERSSQIEEEFKKIIARNGISSVKDLKSHVIGALRFLEKVCQDQEGLVHENYMTSSRYENIITEMEKERSYLLEKNHELSSALQMKEQNENMFEDLKSELDDSISSSSTGLAEEYGQRIPSVEMSLDQHYYFGGRIMAIENDSYQQDITNQTELAPDSDGSSSSDSPIAYSPILKRRRLCHLSSSLPIDRAKDNLE